MIIGIANIIGCKNTSGTSNPPVATSDPVISGTNVVGQTLSCTDGIWTGSLPITFTYQWKRNGLDILGATSSTYVLVQADASNTITCVVTATNIAGSANATSSNSFVILDADAYAFLNASTITDATITTAINVLCVDLKSNNLWTKCYAIYPFVGGTSSTHKWNLKNPIDSDGAYRMIFNGGFTHSSTGVLGNGVNSFADTKFPMNGLPQNDSHLSIYCRTNTTANIIDYGVQFTTVSYSSFITCKLSNNFNSRLNTSGFSDGLTSNTDSKGHYLSYRNNSANITTRKNLNTDNTFAQTSTTAGTNTLPIYLGNLNFNGSPLGGYYSNREYAFATIGTALTAGESTTFYNIIQTFQTTLSRQV